MDLNCDERPSDSPFVQTVWHTHSDQAGDFISMAGTLSGVVVTKFQGRAIFTVRGPETRATPAFCPADAEFIGIQFKPGVFMPKLPATRVKDRADVHLPEANGQSFWLNGSAWKFPDFENADTFVDWLVRDGLLVYDPVVGAVLQGEPPTEMSVRTVQRRFLQATGLTYTTVHQIERARYATRLLKQGMSILDTVYEAGYFDQPHLNRSLKHLIGLTPAQIMDTGRAERLSFLYNTPPFSLSYAGNNSQREEFFHEPTSHRLHSKPETRLAGRNLQSPPAGRLQVYSRG
jgi:AraC-like DNA-binding protein